MIWTSVLELHTLQTFLIYKAAVEFGPHTVNPYNNAPLRVSLLLS